ncbi:MAG: 3-isopropylmalate dehydratase small subunit [Alphaproteobacteria bacterium]|nr:3-isopropylmalate dehydratase small subunit [Alphaproteobacteria bacterium]
MPETYPFSSRSFVLHQENIDTDQIIPARFLTTTSQAGLGRYAFHDWRFDGNGMPRNDNPLSGCDPHTTSILVTGRNFGCGSSREHAPWALLDFGFRAVISNEIADIFHSNAAKNGLLPIIAPQSAHAWLMEHPGAGIHIDLESQTVEIDGFDSFHFDIEPFAKHCLIENTDPLGFLISKMDEIKRYEEARA